MKHWNARQSWSHDSLMKAIDVLLGNPKVETKYDEDVQALRELKNKKDLQESLEGLHLVVDKY